MPKEDQSMTTVMENSLTDREDLMLFLKTQWEIANMI